jgi:hypothetical protein
VEEIRSERPENIPAGQMNKISMIAKVCFCTVVVCGLLFYGNALLLSQIRYKIKFVDYHVLRWEMWNGSLITKTLDSHTFPSKTAKIQLIGRETKTLLPQREEEPELKGRIISDPPTRIVELHFRQDISDSIDLEYLFPTLNRVLSNEAVLLRCTYPWKNRDRSLQTNVSEFVIPGYSKIK